MNGEMARAVTQIHAALLALAATGVLAAPPYQVVEPSRSQRHIELKLMHPMAKTNPVRKIRVEGRTVGEVRKELERHKGLWEDAALDCQGGYNPLTAESPAYDFLAFDIAHASGRPTSFSRFGDDRQMHEVCMTKALELAGRLNRDRNR